MTWQVRIERDSINPTGERLTTAVATYPRIIHAEVLTHRLFSRNAASSRAIPTRRTLEAVRANPFVPEHWGANQRGMQARSMLEADKAQMCEMEWYRARDAAVQAAGKLLYFGLHKQIANRLLEPFTWITVVLTGTPVAWENFFAQRCHPDAEPHMQKLANLLRDTYDDSEPELVDWEEDHVPFIDAEELGRLSWQEARQISSARCARVSYETHDGRRDFAADHDLYQRLVTHGHWSPLEHVATARPRGLLTQREVSNFAGGWLQQRKRYPGEVKRKREAQ